MTIKETLFTLLLRKLGESEPRTTIIGTVLGALLATQVDYGKLFRGDKTEIGKAIGAVLVPIFSYNVNNGNAIAPAVVAVQTKVAATIATNASLPPIELASTPTTPITSTNV